MYTRFYSEVLKIKKQVSFSNPSTSFLHPSASVFGCSSRNGIREFRRQNHRRRNCPFSPFSNCFLMMTTGNGISSIFRLCRCAPYDKFAGVEMRQMEHLLHFLLFISISTLIRLSSIQQVLNGFKFWLFGFFFFERKGPSLHWEKVKCLESFEKGPDFVVRLCFKKNRKRCFDIRNRTLKIIMK